MRIKSIEIENFRAIRKLKVDNLPSLVVIAGGNGVGKSSILDAIILVKAQVRSYESSESDVAQDILKNALRKGEKYAKILLEIEPITDQEKQVSQNKIAKLGLEFKDGSWRQIAENNPGSFFQTPRDGGENVSILEYNPAQRNFSEGPRQLQLQKEDNRNFLGSRSGRNVQNKFGQLKDKIIRLAAYDLLVNKTEKYFPEIVQLIKQLLGREIEVKFNDEGKPPEILVKNDQGVLDVDSLSSGEREILMSYFSIHSLKMSNSILLFDEPDLHLHASSQRAILEYLVGMTKKGNQVFLTSHAAELISTCPTESLFHLSHEYENQLSNIGEESEKISIFEDLGSTKYAFVTYDKTILVEGPTDKKIFTNIKLNNKRINFEIYGGSSNLSPTIIEKISKTSKIGMIKDRDFYLTSEIENFENRSPGNISFLSRREIENFALDSKELFEIYQTLGSNEIKSHAEFLNEIKKISEKYIQQTTADMYFFNYNKQQKIPQPKINDGEQAITAIEHYYEKRIERISQLKANTNSNLVAIEEQLKQKWNDEWLICVDAKLLLMEISRQFFKGKYSMEDLMDMMLLKWIDKNSFPQELVQSMQKLVS